MLAHCTQHCCIQVIYKMLDAMLDEMYPLLDHYGDCVEGLESQMMLAKEPSDTHVRHAYTQRVHTEGDREMGGGRASERESRPVL